MECGLYHVLYILNLFSSITAKDTVDSTVYDVVQNTACWRQRHMLVNRLHMSIKHYCDCYSYLYSACSQITTQLWNGATNAL